MTSAPNRKTVLVQPTIDNLFNRKSSNLAKRRNDSEGKPNKPAEAKQDDKVMKSLQANHSQDSIHQSSNSIASSNQSDPDRDTEDREAKRIKPSRKNSSKHLKLETNSLNRKKDSLTTKNGADAVSSPKGISKKKLKKVVTEPQDLDDEKPIGTVDDTLKPDNVQDIQTENRREIEEDDEESEELSDLIGELSDQGGVSWEKGKPIPYASLAHTFSLIDGTTKRLEIIKYLSQYLVQVISRTPTELLMVIYLCINRLCPDYEGIELGIGESLLIKAISSSMGRTMAQVKAEFQKVGDLGLVAQTSRSTQKTMFQPKLLTVRSVYQDLKAIATISGHSAQTKKVGIITKLLASCQGQEAKFIIRSLEGKLRIGLAERSVLVALATAAVKTNVGNQANVKKKTSPEQLTQDVLTGIEIVKAVYSEIPSYDLVIPALLKDGIQGLRENCKLTPGVPLKPMLAKPTKAISEVLDRFEGQKFTCEYKYDGERAQIHYLSDGSISIFSRNSENMSVKYPDMVDQIPRAIKKNINQSFVLDAEAVAWDPLSKKILPFQELSKRKRKDVKSEEIMVKVKIFAFDLLYLNDQPLANTDLTSRRRLLKEHFQEVEGEFGFAQSVDVDNVDEIQAFLDESVKAGCEGLMVKMLEGKNANYEPSRRSMNWLKIKKDYLAGVGDSFDLVVVGAYYGRGKRTNLYGAFLLACYDPESETYQTICKLGTGFSEEDLESHYKKLQPLELTNKKTYYDIGDSKPDIWFEPKVVWEVLAANLSLSPVYSAAKGLCGDGSRGVSLRFPRYIKERDDKGPEDATGPEQVAEMYKRQVTSQQDARSRNRYNAKDQMERDDDFW